MKINFKKIIKFELWEIKDKDGNVISHAFFGEANSKLQQELMQKEVDYDGGTYYKVLVCEAISWDDAKKLRDEYLNSFWEKDKVK